jgi:hypothetical protein
MTPEERDIIGRFIARVGGAQASGLSGSVPATTTQLPPIDPEADRFIAAQFNAVPEARYRLTQMAFVQEAALTEAQNRIKRLEYELSQARQQAQPQPSKGLFGGLFGGGASQPQQPAYQQPQYAPPPPVYAQGGYQPGMFQGGGSGFFGSALRTAAGVAGGVLAADAISSMFEPHNYGGGFGGGFGGGGFGGGGFGGGEVVNETVVNNYRPQDGGGGDPWAGAGASAPADPSFSQGGDAWSGSGDTSSAGDAWSGGGAADDSGGGWDAGGGSDDSSSF